MKREEEEEEEGETVMEGGQQENVTACSLWGQKTEDKSRGMQ